ncbi:MAG: hypothetical protein Q9221_006723 [Calogaya cf. arnoldii]
MDLVAGVHKEGSRGGRDAFKWEDVKDDQHRENYLGHSLMAPVGRWQKNKDLSWYAKGDDSQAATDAANARAEEIRRIKEAEQDALSEALGYPVQPRLRDSQLAGQKEVEKALKETTEGDEEGGKGVGFGNYLGTETSKQDNDEEVMKGIEDMMNVEQRRMKIAGIIGGIDRDHGRSTYHIRFERLERIAQLPARHCVKTLRYNPWELKECSLESFMAPEFDSDYDWDFPLPPGVGPEPDENASARDRRIWKRSCDKAIGGHTKTKRQIKKEWRRQRALFLDQQSLRDTNYGQAQMDSTIARLVNLKHLILSSEGTGYGVRQPDPPYGLPQTLSILQAIDAAGTNLTRLNLGETNWQILEIKEDQHQMLKRIVISLKSIRLCIATHQEDDDHLDSAEACANLSRQGRLLELFNSMPCLEDFWISCESWMETAQERINLQHVVGKICWGSLRNARLYGVEISPA